MGSSLSDSSRSVLIKARLKPGSIIHVYCDFLFTPKYKFCVVAHTDYKEELLLFFLVNSEKAKFIEHNPELNRCQLPLSRQDYPFFSKEVSWLNCAEVKDDLAIDDVISHLIRTPNDYIGLLLDKEMAEIINIVHGAATIGKNDKELIINSLGS